MAAGKLTADALVGALRCDGEAATSVTLMPSSGSDISPDSREVED